MDVPGTPQSQGPPQSPIASNLQKHTIPNNLTSVKDVGFAENANRKFRHSMEDAHAIVDALGGNLQRGFFAVYDGHGGKEAADLVETHLHETLSTHLSDLTYRGDIDGHQSKISEALEAAYAKTDALLGEAQLMLTGTTAVTALVEVIGDAKYLFCANAGDARAVLESQGGVTRLSYDHTAKDMSEQDRIRAAGGFVSGGRVDGILAVSRALGDHAFKQYVTSKPYITVTPIKADGGLLILACDGVWDVMTDAEAVEYIRDLKTAQEMADHLVYKALDLGSMDNVTAIVVQL